MSINKLKCVTNNLRYCDNRGLSIANNTNLAHNEVKYLVQKTVECLSDSLRTKGSVHISKYVFSKYVKYT